MQHKHGVSDSGLFAAAVCIALVYKSTFTYEVGPIFYALSSIKVFAHHHLTIFPTLNTGIEYLNLVLLSAF